MIDKQIPPSLEYRRWEKEILATEEIVLETLCFDMGIEQPWVILRRSIRGMDDMWLDNNGESSKWPATAVRDSEMIDGEEGEVVDPKGKGKPRPGKVTEGIVAELGWAILSEA
jgi:hypothetical protein